MIYRHSIDRCLDTEIGEHGLNTERLGHWLAQLAPRLESLKQEVLRRESALFRVVERSDDIEDARRALARLLEGGRTLLFFGTGGSSLGGQTIAQLGGWCIPGDCSSIGPPLARTRFYDNLDPRSLHKGLALLKPAETRFVVISKSGNTAETLMQTLTALNWVRRAGLESKIPNMFLGLSEPETPGRRNGLRALFTHLGIPMLDHDPEIGGRFSALSNVGMLPALARGLDCHALRAGAHSVLSDLLNAQSPYDFAPALGAAIAIGLAKEKDVRVSVMMPYADRLSRFAHWYVQLWAESLGKSGEGTTPLAALGPVDQHSQLQLFMDGPRDHLITIIRPAPEGDNDPPAPADLARLAGASYLADRRISDLVRAQQQAIADALTQAQRPVRTIDVDNLDERALGALMMHMMLETILAAHLLDVDPFGQPAVELGKQLTREYLGKPAPGDA